MHPLTLDGASVKFEDTRGVVGNARAVEASLPSRWRLRRPTSPASSPRGAATEALRAPVGASQSGFLLQRRPSGCRWISRPSASTRPVTEALWKHAQGLMCDPHED